MMIPGLQILSDFITQEEHSLLLTHITPTRVTVPTTGRNTIKRYGSKLPYVAPIRSVIIPEYLTFLCKRIAEQNLAPYPDSLTINEYKVGQNIPYHKDSATSGPVICVLSLLSECIMGMRWRETDNNKHITYIISPRSMVVMEGPARDEWEHCIYPVIEDRFSIVFRKGTIN